MCAILQLLAVHSGKFYKAKAKISIPEIDPSSGFTVRSHKEQLLLEGKLGLQAVMTSKNLYLIQVFTTSCLEGHGFSTFSQQPEFIDRRANANSFQGGLRNLAKRCFIDFSA